MSWNIAKRSGVTFILTLAVFVIMASPVHAFTEISDEELSQITGEGFSSFTLENGVAKAFFNIEARTFTEIDSFKLGYYDDGSTGFGWDEDWINVSLGSAAEDLICKGLFIEAKFTDLTNATGYRSLDYIKIGTPSMTGSVSANFISFSGRIMTAGVPVVDAHRLKLTPDGYRTTITSTGSPNAEFYLKLESSGVQRGWWAFWGDATVTHALVP